MTDMAVVLGPIGELRAHALAYAEAGLEIFPANPRTKAPLTTSGMKDATVDPDQIGRWWDQHPGALIAHRIPPDIVVVDVDPRHGGNTVWTQIRAEIGGFPVTRAHTSGRGDGGGHIWWRRPDDKLTTRPLDQWARDRGLGENLGNGHWTAGIDLLRHEHRYTILPPSPHPDTGRPYCWIDGRGLDITPAPMPALLADLLTEQPIDTPPPPPRPPDPDSIADWYTDNHTWTDLLHRHGWQLVAGDGHADGSRWRHPKATSASSATIRHRCLFVYSPNTPFEETTTSDPHGYTLFRAWAVLDHHEDLAAAARHAREQRDGPARVDDISWAEQQVARQQAATEPAATQPEEDERLTFRRWTTSELLTADRTFHWRLRGVLVQPTYGMIGGEQKTLKSYVSTFLDLAVATGHPLFDRFTVDDPGPVVAYIGEGGRIPYTRRLERIAQAMGINPADADLHPTFDIAPIASTIFTDSLRRDLDELQPALVHIDPYYAYHGADAKASDLHQEGALLNRLSVPCVNAGACLLVNHHFNKTGTTTGISRLTMAGGQEWVDTWILLSHRHKPDVENGEFQLLLEIGSRQWGGNSWDLDLHVGRFDIDTGEYDGTITWDLRRHTDTDSTDQRRLRTAETILAALADHPGELTPTELVAAVGGRKDTCRDVLKDLIASGQIIPERETNPTGGRRQRRTVLWTPWQLGPNTGAQPAEPDF